MVMSPPPEAQPGTPKPSSYLTTAEVAAELRTSTDFVQRKCRNGDIPGAMFLGRRGGWRIPADALTHFAEPVS